MLMSSSKRLYEKDIHHTSQPGQSLQNQDKSFFSHQDPQDIFFSSRGESNIVDSVILSANGSQHNKVAAMYVKDCIDYKEPLLLPVRLLGKRTRDDKESSVSPRTCKESKSDQSGHTGDAMLVSIQPEIQLTFIKKDNKDGSQNIEFKVSSLFNTGHCMDQSQNCKSNELNMTQIGSSNNDVTSSNGS